MKRRIVVGLILFTIVLIGGFRMDSRDAVSYTHTNRLIHEKSPYLLQHAHNPVDWYPWGPDAFEKAKKENKPIFLSIGYSTCHWCHVMERESFEKEDVAKLMNGHFVCVKVDREERPDVDQIYMNAVMALTGQGGWPLNLFLTPDLKPFYGGTYFPPDGRYGRPGFPAILADVDRAWKNQPDQVEKAGEQMAEYVAKNLSATALSPTRLGESTVAKTAEEYVRISDERDGGFGGAPKFPRSMTLGSLLRAYRKTGNPLWLAPVEKTLDKMGQGGIYDQIGGGFARYSTDEVWLVPHFEKMLYDNALLSRAYLEGYQVTGKAEYARIAREIFAYLFRDMTDPAGGFYSAEDADSEGEEGKFYVWTPEEWKDILGEKDGWDLCRIYGVTERGNFEGHNIPHLQTDLESTLAAEGKTEAWWREVREKVLQARSKRVRPHLDDKVLTAWNGLMISSLAYGYQVLGDASYLAAAEKASAFIRSNLTREGRLLVSWRKGPSDVEGFIDDYAFYQQAQLDLYESTFNLDYLREALRLYDVMLRYFWDDPGGAFFFSGSDQKDLGRLLARPMEAYDGAIPSGNSVAALNFYRLAEWTGRKDIRDKADAILSRFSGVLTQTGTQFPQMLQAFQFDYDGTSEILVVGEKADSEKALRALWRAYLPNKVLVYAEPRPPAGLVELVPWVEGRPSLGGRATCYVCRDYQCQVPTTDPAQALKELGITSTTGSFGTTKTR